MLIFNKESYNVSQNHSDLKEDTGINHMIILEDKIVFPIFAKKRR
ncbi:hypothetical protein HMPREF1068_00438 [Bacteroides nordii CL02T12C05]|uniref:Uncharacterized protein n=1 Tax=Bacteroides nordii CL02T12C05 TaxID=997884 RepID=I8XWK9_9BACE|nr:hypothetical protein HMPREF1068_00438 [Bacteroides nordii CL02T12C05]